MSDNSPVTPEMIREAAREAGPLKRAVEEANGVYRACLKKLKAKGINQKALIAAIKARGQDPEAVRLEMRERVLYFSALGMPTQQGDLFSGPDLHDAGRDQGDQQEFDAEDAGYGSGKGGQPSEANPHAPGSPAHVMWHKGWTRGQAFIAKTLGQNNAKMAGQTVKARGARKAAGVTAPAVGKPRGRPPGSGKKGNVVPLAGAH